jgi:hypothetical protein
MDPEDSLVYSQGLATGSYPEPVEISSHSNTQLDLL